MDITGGHARVEIFKNERGYSARIVGLRKPHYDRGEVTGMDGEARVDLNNPDSSVRQRALMGLEIMSGFAFDKGKWVGGRLYDPQKGKTYKCAIFPGRREVESPGIRRDLPARTNERVGAC